LKNIIKRKRRKRKNKDNLKRWKEKRRGKWMRIVLEY
jgi:hypothetical protein